MSQNSIQQKTMGFESFEPRNFCYACRRPRVSCYCSAIVPFDSSPRFVILMHPHEVKKPIGTGRMAHRCLSNSSLWVGESFENDPRLIHLLEEQSNESVVLLYPGSQSLNLTKIEPKFRKTILTESKNNSNNLCVIVLDATWSYSKKILFRTPRLQNLQRVCFDPPHPSRFLIRKQPKENYFSTIEAIDETLNLLGSRHHGNLMEVFLGMVNKQLEYRRVCANSRHRANYFRRQERLVSCVMG